MYTIKTRYNDVAFTGKVRVVVFYYVVMTGAFESLVVHRRTAMGNFMAGNSFPLQVLAAWILQLVAEIASSKRAEPWG